MILNGEWRMEKDKYNDLSDIQKEKYKSVSGHNYVECSISGNFPTLLAYCKTVWKSPWLFKFQFYQETGKLFCFLAHRMTNERIFGWDYEGNKIEYKEVEKIFPIYPALVPVEKE